MNELIKQKIDEYIAKERESILTMASCYPLVQLYYVMKKRFKYSKRNVQNALHLENSTYKMISKEFRKADDLLFDIYFSPMCKEHIFNMLRKEVEEAKMDIMIGDDIIQYLFDKATLLELQFTRRFAIALRQAVRNLQEYGFSNEEIDRILISRKKIEESHDINTHPENIYGAFDRESLISDIETYAFDQILYILIIEKEVPFNALKKIFKLKKGRYMLHVTASQDENLKQMLFISIDEMSKVFDTSRQYREYVNNEQAIKYMEDINRKSYDIAVKHYKKTQKEILDQLVKNGICEAEEDITERVEMLIAYCTEKAV